MLEAIRELIRGRDLCVLSTVSGGRPHCSLMSYVTDLPCRTFYMLTRVETRKYRNLERNSAVCLLIDTREEDTGKGRDGIRALTVGGEFQPIEDPGEQRRVLGQLLARHPHLAGLAEGGQARPFAVRAKSFQLLDGVSRSRLEEAD